MTFKLSWNILRKEVKHEAEFQFDIGSRTGEKKSIKYSILRNRITKLVAELVTAAAASPELMLRRAQLSPEKRLAAKGRFFDESEI